MVVHENVIFVCLWFIQADHHTSATVEPEANVNFFVTLLVKEILDLQLYKFPQMRLMGSLGVYPQ